MNIRTFFGGAPFLAVLIGGLTALGAETSAVPEPGDLRAAGTVDFPVSCAPAVRAEFIRGVALLHSFFYEEARRIFTAVAARGSKLRHGAMGNRHDMVASDLDASDSRRNECRQGSNREGDGNDCWHRSRAGFITALNAYYNTPDSPTTGEVGQSCHGPVGAARSRDRV